MAKRTTRKKNTPKRARMASVVRRNAPFWPYGLFMFAVLLLADQLTKRWIYSSYAFGESHQIFPWLSFTHVHNTGALWSLAQGVNGLFIWISFIAFGALLYWHDQFKTIVAKCCYVLIMVGLWGNLIDRITLGFVIDFVDLGWWPVFNIADSALCVAIVVMLLEQWRVKN